MKPPISVDIWSDVQCPWCYIGKRRFETALETFTAANPEQPVNIVYHSFELSPDTPEGFVGTPLEYLSERKGLSREQVLEMFAQVTQIAAAEGLEYHFERAQQVNTRKAHELLHYAKDKGKQLETKEALLRAFFTEGLNLGDVDTLADVGAAAGLDRSDALAALEAGTFENEVTLDEQKARDLGINGVPFFAFNNTYGVSGAQSPAVFLETLEKVSHA